MARARYEIRHAVSANVRDLLIGTVTQTTGQTVWVDTAAYVSPGDLVGGEIYVYAGPGAGQSRRIATHVQDTANGVAQVTPFRPWDQAPVANASLVEIHLPQFDFTVQKINEAIQGAHRAAEDGYLTDVVDETVTTQAGRHHYPIPAGFRSLHSVEEDFPADVGVPGSVYDSGALNWGSQFYDRDESVTGPNQQRLGQGFHVTSGGQPQGYWSGGAALYLRRIGTLVPGANLQCRIARDSGGLPGDLDLDGTFGWGERPAADVDATYAMVQFRWQAPVFVPSDLPCHLTLWCSSTYDPFNYVAWGEDTATSYNRGAATRQASGVWTVIPNAALIFAIQTSQINERYRSIPRDDPDGPRRRVVASSEDGAPLLWLRDPAEGARLRLRGQGIVPAPLADTDPVLVPESFLVPKATSLLLAMQGSGPTMDADNRDRWALYHANQAERELIRCRTQFAPNSEMVTAR
jgi:hypothetical protein